MKQGASAFGIKKAPRGSEGSGNNGGAKKADAMKMAKGSLPTVNKKRNKVLTYGSRTNY